MQTTMSLQEEPGKLGTLSYFFAISLLCVLMLQSKLIAKK